MKYLTNRNEISETINYNKMPIVRIDGTKKDEYGLTGTKVRIATRDQGYIRATIRTYDDENGFHFYQGALSLKKEFGYRDIEEMLEYANAPIIKADQDVCVVLVNGDLQTAIPMILHTSKEIKEFCATPLKFEDQ